MQTVKFGQNHVDLQTDMFCMKRQLAIILDENHLLKVKIRRLENDLMKKNKYIDYLHINTQKCLDARRLSYENSSNTVLQLKKQNAELREMLLQNDLDDQKRKTQMKKMLLYKQYNSKSNPIVNTLKKSTRVQNSQTSFDNEKLAGSKILESSSDTKAHLKACYRSFSNTSRNYSKTPYTSQSNTQELLDIIRFLKEQRNIDRNKIYSRNTEISKLFTELEDTKAQLQKERGMKTTYSCHLHNSCSSGDAKSVIMNKRLFSKSIEFDRPEMELSISSLEPKKTKLEPVQEISENETLSDISDKSAIYRQKESCKPKTQIEYVIDSEVSTSDGEDIYMKNNVLSNYHRKTTGTMSRNNDYDIHSFTDH